MNNSFHMISIILLFALIGFSKLVAQGKASAEVQAAIDKTYSVWEKQDIEIAKQLYANDVVMFGTDAAEFWTSWDNMEPAAIAQFEAVKDPTFNVKDQILRISPSGDMACFLHKVDMTVTVDGQTLSMDDVRVSGVFEKIGIEWKLVQGHWSIGVQGQVVEY